MPIPLADVPRLKNRALTENRGVSGNKRTANGSSNDSSISLCVKELFTSKGGLFQSNSILGLTVNNTPMQCIYIVFTHSVSGSQELFSFDEKKVATEWTRWPAGSKLF